jgi:hypothetical protein
LEINLFPKFLDEAATPVAQSVGKTLSSIWSIVFGGIDSYADKTNFKRGNALNKFKEELEQKVSSVPVEKLIEPPLHIIGPSLDASKFYFESDDLRVMFANLIAASINIDTFSMTHPSFVEIIKQLSPLDAVNLKLFKISDSYPVARYDLIAKDRTYQGYKTIKNNIFLENNDVSDIDINSSSVTNLSRLGLVNFDYEHFLTIDGVYDKFKNTDYFNKINNIYTSGSYINDSFYNIFTRVEIKNGLVILTPFGHNFINICIND